MHTRELADSYLLEPNGFIAEYLTTRGKPGPRLVQRNVRYAR
jgi:hypothetical protein